MSWADGAIAALAGGERVRIHPRGHSMRPRIHSEWPVLLAPVTTTTPLEAGDIVLVRVRGRVYLHCIQARDGGRYKIGNMRGHTNGWVHRDAVFGIAVAIGPDEVARSLAASDD